MLRRSLTARVRCGSPDPTGEQLQRLVPLLRTNSTSNAFTLNHLCMYHVRAEEGIREFTH